VQLDDGRWIWSTFYHYQWDLNYANPAVFRAMAGEMLFLANQGVEVLRMDAVAFIWKRLGTSCESLPKRTCCCRRSTPCSRWLRPGWCSSRRRSCTPTRSSPTSRPRSQLSYNPLQMALTWEALATRDGRLLQDALDRATPCRRHGVGQLRAQPRRHRVDLRRRGCRALGIDGYAHRQFLNRFYTGRHDGTFARGVAFQENPATGDARVTGTTASLAGIEAGDRAARTGRARARLALSTGGIPLLYLGDEVAQLNDYSYADDPVRRGDSRWVHRGNRPRDAYAQRGDDTTPAGRSAG
jgi:amylosucrase